MAEIESTRPSLNCHPACELLPEMTETEFRDLVEDIRVNWLRHAIIVDDENGLILDGRHRYRALLELGFDPGRYITSPGPIALSEAGKIALVMSENINRRHLTIQQRGAIAAELATMRSGTRTDLASTDAKSRGLSDADAAKVMGVSEPTVERAKRRMRTDPAAHAKAKAGTLGRAKPTPRTTKPKPIDGNREPKPKPFAEPKLEPIEGVDYELMEDRWGFKHRKPIGATKLPSFLIDEAVRILGTMARVAKVAEAGDKAALEQIIHGANLVNLTVRLMEAAQEHERAPAPALKLVEPEPEQADLKEAPAPANGFESADDLRSRLRAVLTKLDLSETRFAKHAGIPQPSLNRFMLGQGKTTKGNLSKIEAALGGLADYATA